MTMNGLRGISIMDMLQQLDEDELLHDMFAEGDGEGNGGATMPLPRVRRRSVMPVGNGLPGAPLVPPKPAARRGSRDVEDLDGDAE